jgi:hypothetical protein
MRGNYKANDGTLYPFYRCDKRRGQWKFYFIGNKKKGLKWKF